MQPLGAGALVPKQIQFTNDGRVLVVTENGSNTIDTFVVGPNEKAGPAITTPSTGGGPFGFDFDRAGYLLVSDAGLSTGRSGATSYDVAGDGTVTANGPAVPIDQAAACWLVAAGHFAYTANAAAATSAATPSRPTAPSPSSAPRGRERPTSLPHEEGVSADQNYLYVLAQGLSQIVGYRVGADGSLTQVTTVPVAAGSFGVGAN